MIYLFTLCEYGGQEVASCELICEEDFAHGFERGLNLRINQETHYIVREEIGEDGAGRARRRARALGRRGLKRSCGWAPLALF